MIFSVEKIIEYVSSFLTLERGDLIFTGTPEGVGPVVAGDVIEAELVGYAKISHRVIAD
jgi:2-keto-4-pentenoate hydratase/2-oxohepta-3-ene-1,7-dioic acid hydratase in catechol pathway